MRKLNALTRSQRFETNQAALRPLPAEPRDFTCEVSVRVSRFSLIRVLNNYLISKWHTSQYEQRKSNVPFPREAPLIPQ